PHDGWGQAAERLRRFLGIACHLAPGDASWWIDDRSLLSPGIASTSEIISSISLGYANQGY
ncbi:hypothetical protein, partial [Paraburkholderia sp. CI2]|uniref:hypothetical protein n=1 Tax=Paraburkholderia sp. CI2 TaxID=2723093 RepID=UPI001C8539C4